jgi:hypothetical protein
MVDKSVYLMVVCLVEKLVDVEVAMMVIARAV